jgi:hypothetical protein
MTTATLAPSSAPVYPPHRVVHGSVGHVGDQCVDQRGQDPLSPRGQRRHSGRLLPVVHSAGPVGVRVTGQPGLLLGHMPVQSLPVMDVRV